jgi:predicted outer membrane protein
MNRRYALMTLSGAMATPVLAALPRLAVAQTTKLPTLDHSQYKAQTLMIGALSKQTSVLAAERSHNPKVKQFADFEVNEQNTMAQVIENDNDPKPAALDPEHAAILTRLQGASDKEFDRAYVQEQLTAHAELLSAQQSFLNDRPSDDDYRHIAMMARTTIQMHITMLHDLQAMLTT